MVFLFWFNDSCTLVSKSMVRGHTLGNTNEKLLYKHVLLFSSKPSKHVLILTEKKIMWIKGKQEWLLHHIFSQKWEKVPRNWFLFRNRLSYVNVHRWTAPAESKDHLRHINTSLLSRLQRTAQKKQLDLNKADCKIKKRTKQSRLQN